MRLTLLMVGLAAVVGASLLALRVIEPPQAAPEPLAHARDAGDEPLPPELLSLQIVPLAAGEAEILVTNLPQDAGYLELAVSTEGPAALSADKGDLKSRIGAGATESRRFRARWTASKPGGPAAAFVAEATLVENGIALLGRSYRLELGAGDGPPSPAPMPEIEPDGRGGWVRVYAGETK